ncbi:hypothetical protein K2Y11_24710 [bacterium]|nr:hypothetical protein [bacterium]
MGMFACWCGIVVFFSWSNNDTGGIIFGLSVSAAMAFVIILITIRRPSTTRVVIYKDKRPCKVLIVCAKSTKRLRLDRMSLIATITCDSVDHEDLPVTSPKMTLSLEDNQKSIILIETRKHDSVAYEQMTDALTRIGSIIGESRCKDQTIISINSPENTRALFNSLPAPAPRYRKINFLKNGIRLSDAPSLGSCALVAGLVTYILLMHNWDQIHFGIVISSILVIIIGVFTVRWHSDFIEFDTSNQIITIHRIFKRQELRFSDIIGVISVSYYSSESKCVADIMLLHGSPVQKILITSTNFRDEVNDIIELICQTVNCTCLAQI